MATLSSTLAGGSPAYTYTWSNGSNFSGTNVSPSVTTTYTLNISDANGCNMSAITTVSVNQCDVLNEIAALKKEIFVYPSRTNGVINFETTLVVLDVSCSDQLGRNVKIEYARDKNQISLNDVEVGIYYLIFRINQDQKIVKKIIKE
jgi:hypothetical protein